MSYNLAHVHTLTLASRHHELQGNTLLASWFMDSTTYVGTCVRTIDHLLDSMPLGNYEHACSTSPRQQYTHDWFAYEDEYAYNFSGLE